MPLIPCGCRLIKCTDTYDPSFADNLGVWWQVSCGCRLYPCVDEVTSHSPSPTSSRESLTAPLPLQFTVEHNTLQEHFLDAQQSNIDWPFDSDPVHDLNQTYNDNNAFEPDIVDWRIHHRECGNLLDPNGICLYDRPLCSRQALDSDLLDRRSLQREVDTTREQLRQVENERDDLKIQLQKLTEDAWGESAADFRNGFHAKYRSSREWSKLNKPSSDRPDFDDATRRSLFNHSPVNDYQSPQIPWRRPLQHRTFFARAQDDSLISKPSSCCCTRTTSADSRPFVFPSSVNSEGRSLFSVYGCKCCGWCRYWQQLECDYISLSDEPEACSCSTSGTTGSTTSDTSRIDTDHFATNQYQSNCSSTFRQDYISGSRCMQPHPRAAALHYHAYPCGYESHIPCPIKSRNLSMCGCRIGVRIRPRSFSLPPTIPRHSPYFHEYAPCYHAAPRIISSRALRGTIVLRRLMLASYTILAALVGIVATNPVENVEMRRVSGVFIGLVGFLAVSSWLVGRNLKGRMGRRM